MLRPFLNRQSLVVFVVLFLSFAYFQHSEPGWNVNSRFVLTLALAETGSPQVERYVSRQGLQTEDLAAFNGHLYSDKSIGTSLLAIPAAGLTRMLEAIGDTTFSTGTRRWIVTVFSVGIAGAIAGVLLLRWLTLIWKRDHPASGFSAYWIPLAAIATILGSMLFLYGTLLMSYLPATAFLLACLIAIESGERSARTVLLAGIAGGLAILCEYTYAAAVGLAGLYMMIRHWRQFGEKPVSFGKVLLSGVMYGTGVIAGVLPFIIYTMLIFGKPTIPYEYHLMPQFREAMAKGFMGAGWPNLQVLWLITFHPFRGIFVYSPLLLMGFIGLLILAIRYREQRLMAALCLASTLFYLLFNSAYYMWWGGWSFAPRHLAPAIPFLAAGLLPWLQNRTGRFICGIAGLGGIFVHTMVNATEPQPPDGGWQEALLRPDLRMFEYPAVFLQDTWQRISAGHFDLNLGSVAGLNGAISLAPLLLCWMVAAAILISPALQTKISDKSH